VTPKKAAKGKQTRRQKPKAGKAKPSTNGNNGRDKSGKFTVGNKGGPGNPHARHVAQIRSLFTRKATEQPEVFERLFDKLVEMALAGDLAAIKELLDRVLGKATQPIDADIKINWGDRTTEEVMEAAAQALRDAGWTVEPPK